MRKKLVIIALTVIMILQLFGFVPCEHTAFAAQKPAESASELVAETETEPIIKTETEVISPVQETELPDEPEEKETEVIPSSPEETELPALIEESEILGPAEETEPVPVTEEVIESEQPVTESESKETEETEEELKRKKAGPESLTSEQVIGDGYYYIRCAGAKDFGLDIKGGKTSSGINAQIYRHNGTRAQIFQVTFDEKTSLYRILNEKSGLALTQQAGSDNVRQETVTGGERSQLWVIQKNKDGSYSFVNAGSGLFLQADAKPASEVNASVGKLSKTKTQSFTFDSKMDMVAASIMVKDQSFNAKSQTPAPEVLLCGKKLKNGTDFRLSYKDNMRPGTASVTLTGIGSYKGSVTKSFKITVSRIVPNGIYFIANAFSPDYVLDVTSGSTAARANIQLYKRNNTPAQMFYLEWKGNGEYKISNVKSNMTVDVSGGSINDHANIQQYPSNNTGAQRWYIFSNADGSFSIANQKSLKTIDIENTRIANRTNIQQFRFHDARAQKFTFITVPDSAKEKMIPGPNVYARKYMPGVKVTWNAVSGMDKYRVYRRSGSGNWQRLADVSGRVYIDKKVSAGTTYYYTVRCISSDGKKLLSGFQSPGAAYTTPNRIPKTGNELRQMVVNHANSYIGIKGQSPKHKHLIDVFNQLQPDGYPMYYHSSWCAAFVSAVTMEVMGNDCANQYFPLSYNCENIILRSMKLKIWVEKDSYAPKPGDWIIYDWEDKGKGEDVKGYDHVGMVKSRSGNTFTVIEGNYRNACAYRTVEVNQRYIRGFVSPDYDAVLK